MPICAEPGCPTVVVRGYCAAHARRSWERSQPVPRIRGRRLQRLRARLFREHPLCVQCYAEGRVTVATIRDHIVPLAEGGPDDETNVQPLCQSCSDVKTSQESKHGRGL